MARVGRPATAADRRGRQVVSPMMSLIAFHAPNATLGAHLDADQLGRFSAGVESYIERPPLPELAGVVRTVWIQRTGPAAYVQRHLPTGGVELHFPIGGQPRLVGPLTGASIE